MYTPRPVQCFTPTRIVLAKGSATTEDRRRMVERVCQAYPDAKVVEASDTPHNKVQIDHQGLLDLHAEGKRTLVLGEHRSAVRFSSESGNSCPNYWHFSPYGFCPYGCHYMPVVSVLPIVSPSVAAYPSSLAYASGYDGSVAGRQTLLSPR